MQTDARHLGWSSSFRKKVSGSYTSLGGLWAVAGAQRAFLTSSSGRRRASNAAAADEWNSKPKKGNADASKRPPTLPRLPMMALMRTP